MRLGQVIAHVEGSAALARRAHRAANKQLHEKANIAHSNAGWRAVERFAKQLHMEDAVVAACEANLRVWEMYLDGIGAAGDAANGL